MSAQTEGNAPLAAFLALAFGGSSALSLIAATTGGAASPHLRTLGVSAMFVPAFAVLLVGIGLRARVPDRGWRRFPLRWLAVALFALPIAIHAFALPATILLEGRLPWADWLSPASDGLFHPPAARGWGALTPLGLAGRFALNAVVGLAIVSFLASFEEIGWRAWMLPRLAGRLGDRLGAVASAAIWAAWHAPFALSGIHHLDHVPTAALILIAPLGHFGAGLFLAALWLRTRSIVVVSLAHGSLNNWGQYAFKYMEGDGAHDTALLAVVGCATLAVGVLSASRATGVAKATPVSGSA